MKKFTLALSTILLAFTASVGAQTSAHVPTTVRKITIGGDGGWDYLTADAASKRLYVSRSNRIIVLDTESERVVGELAGTPGVHGIAVVPDLNRGFTSNGGDDTVTAFDLKTLKETGRVKVGGRPDAIMFEPTTNRVFTFNHGSKDATAVEPSGVKVAGTVALGGVPEAAVADGRGHVFVNIMDKNEVVEFDAQATSRREPLVVGAGQHPTGLAMDCEHRRLYSVCGGNQTMVVLDADSGHVLATLPIGRGSDGCALTPLGAWPTAPTAVTEHSPSCTRRSPANFASRRRFRPSRVPARSPSILSAPDLPLCGDLRPCSGPSGQDREQESPRGGHQGSWPQAEHGSRIVRHSGGGRLKAPGILLPLSLQFPRTGSLIARDVLLLPTSAYQ